MGISVSIKSTTVSIGLSYSVETKVDRSTDLKPDEVKNPTIIHIVISKFLDFLVGLLVTYL